MEFENKINITGKGLTGVELSNSPSHDDVVMVRAIELNKESIRKDPVILFSSNSIKVAQHIYKEYCATMLHNKVEDLNIEYIRRAINLCFLND